MRRRRSARAACRRRARRGDRAAPRRRRRRRDARPRPTRSHDRLHRQRCRRLLAGGLPLDAAVLREEIFGPLLAVEAAASVDEALERVDMLPFALTGGLFSRNPRTVERVAARTPVGNLYVNRHITGAMVGRQPFGGNRLSGTGAQAGGPDYLLQFVEPHVVSESTLRR